jgi:hypothetical protein
MDPVRRKELEKVALDQLNASADDGWSYLFGAADLHMFGLCPWSAYDGETSIQSYCLERLELPRSEERLHQLEEGEADPSEVELCQWRREMCRRSARERPNTMALIKPSRRDSGEVEAFDLGVRHEQLALA